MGSNDSAHKNANENKVSHANNRIDRDYRKAAINKRRRQINAERREY